MSIVIRLKNPAVERMFKAKKKIFPWETVSDEMEQF